MDIGNTQHRHKSSIDLTLELEHQLNAREEPPSDISLDPDVLSCLVIQLRANIAELNQIRDDLLTSLAHSHSQEASLRDTLALAEEKNEAFQKELEELRNRTKDDQDTISLLRQKVEESRRGLMRLQFEQRRTTLQPPSRDIAKPDSASKSAKRASFTHNGPEPFTPLTGSSFVLSPRGHRRVSSVSEQGSSAQYACDDAPSSPVLDTEVSKPKSANRLSSIFRTSLQLEQDAPAEIDVAETLRQELRQIKQELESTKVQLAESQEQQEASESCVKALRDFITDNAVGESCTMSPPLSFGTAGKKGPSGWGGLRLWRYDPNSTSSEPTSISSVTSSESPITPSSATTVTPLTSLPLSKKLGELFSRPNATPVSHTQDTMLAVESDGSSVIEPEEPASPDRVVEVSSRTISPSTKETLLSHARYGESVRIMACEEPQ